ncbi:hypothetical protein [Desulfobacula sp.]|uniref:hypothetical protein n=1 Tax=Desulfobacula sp. TaxID=2593537 RepID=UPI00260391C9|nr:hypothetical protein [Desulfobacula sp.]
MVKNFCLQDSRLHGKFILEKVPPLLQEKFTSKFSKLKDGEQLLIENTFKWLEAQIK